MEYQKVSRHSLLPVIPIPYAYADNFGIREVTAWDVPIKWIKEYADKLADYVHVVPCDVALVERVERETGKKVIPTISLFEFDGVPPCKCDTKLSSEFQPTAKQAAWVEYIKSRINDWPWVMLTNADNLMDFNQGNHPLPKHFDNAAQYWPEELMAKFAYAPWDLAIAAEASPPGGPVENSFVLRHFLDRKSLVCVYMGYTHLYPDLPTYLGDGCTISGTVWLHAINRKDPNWYSEPDCCFPYPKLQRWYKALGKAWHEAWNAHTQPVEQTTYYAQGRREACSFSGIGYYTGAAKHNLSKLVDFGFTGACFYVPVTDGDEGRKQMDLYTTDVS